LKLSYVLLVSIWLDAKRQPILRPSRFGNKKRL
jgi:hypothetical protein